MTRQELEHELQTIQEELEEVEETLAPHAPQRSRWGSRDHDPAGSSGTSAGVRQAVLGQTGVHVGVRLLQQYRARFDRDQARFEKRLAEIRTELAALEQEQPP